jgi:hypothetical protein
MMEMNVGATDARHVDERDDRARPGIGDRC